MTTRAKVTQAEVERMLRAASKCDQPATNDNIAGPKQWPAT